MSIVTKWLLWSRKLYLLFPLKSLLFLQLILFYPLFLHNGGATQSKECHFIFSGRYLHRNILLIPYRRELSFVFEFECGFRSWKNRNEKKWKSRMGECHKNRNWTMLHLILSMRSHRIECMPFYLSMYMHAQKWTSFWNVLYRYCINVCVCVSLEKGLA